MKVESIAECSLGAFCNTFDLHKVIIDLENHFFVFFLSGRVRQVLLNDYVAFGIKENEQHSSNSFPLHPLF